MSSGWGGSSIDKKLFTFIRKTIPTGSTILELGSGWATGELAKHYTMYSVEHDMKYIDKYNSTYLHVPLKEHKAIKNHKYTKWYDAVILRSKLKGIKYDLLLVDGPPSVRSGFFKYMTLFDSSIIWVFDDTNRHADAKVLNSVAAKLDRPWVTYHGGTDKTFGVINNPLLSPISLTDVEETST